MTDVSPPPLRELAPLGYPIIVGADVGGSTLDGLADLIERVAPAHTLAIIADATVARLHGPRLDRALASRQGGGRRIALTVPPGEASKNRTEWARLTDAMLEAGCGRDTTVIAFGGGMVGDLAGFVAATYMRGLPVVQVPTTLLAMVDASIGGKTAVDTPKGKNLVGAFHQPVAVVADLEMLRTLSERELRAGMAEIIKHGVIASEDHFAHASDLLPRVATGDATARAQLADLIADSIAIKGGVVSRDEREQGERRILNFGHTVAHAVETASAFALLHGEAVAIGLCVEAELSERVGTGIPGLADRVRVAVRSVGLPDAIPRDLATGTLMELMRGDKKNRAGQLVFALPQAIGAMAGAHADWAVPVNDADVAAILDQSR